MTATTITLPIDSTMFVIYAPWLLTGFFFVLLLYFMLHRPKPYQPYVRKVWKAKIPAEMLIEEESNS